MLSKNDILEIKKLVDNSEEKLQKIISASEKRLSDKIDKVQETVDIVQNVMVVHYTKLEKRVEKIEGQFI